MITVHTLTEEFGSPLIILLASQALIQHIAGIVIAHDTVFLSTFLIVGVSFLEVLPHAISSLVIYLPEIMISHMESGISR